MSNLRIIYQNLTDSSNSLSASTTSGSLVVANLKTDRKGEIHRSTGTSVTFTCTWSSSQSISSVVIPACNLTSAATIQVRLYDAESAGTLLLDTGVLLACQGQNITSTDAGSPITVTDFSRGIATKAAAWFNQVDLVRRIVIDIVDTSNPAGFIDTSRLIIGTYWSPKNNASYGAETSLVDSSDIVRTDSGGISVFRSCVYEKMNLNLEFMASDDRKALDKITRLTAGYKPILISLVPDGTDYNLIQETTIYGVRQLNAVALLEARWSSSISIESW